MRFRSLVLTATIVFTLLAMRSVRADTLFTNLNQTLFDSAGGDAVGQAIVNGASPVFVTSIDYSETIFGPATGETFSIFSRNTNGTLGNALFTNFTVAYNSTTGIATATAATPAQLQANTGYFLVAATPNSANNNEAIWDYTDATQYTSAYGITLPTANASFTTNAGVTTYYPLADGPQLFQINGNVAPVPEASTYLSLCGLLAMGGLATLRLRKTLAKAA